MRFEPSSMLNDSRRSTRLILLAIILLTLPCYCLGAILLAYAPDDDNRQAGPVQTRPTLGGATSQPSPTFTPFFTATFTPLGATLQPTPLQIYLRTTIPFFPSPTLTLTPTNTVIPTATLAPTLTLVPTNPPPPTPTLPPSATNTAVPLPTNTEVPPPTNTEVPPATLPLEASPTQEGG